MRDESRTVAEVVMASGESHYFNRISDPATLAAEVHRLRDDNKLFLVTDHGAHLALTQISVIRRRHVVSDEGALW